MTTDTNTAVQFITKVFGPSSSAAVFVCSLPNTRDGEDVGERRLLSRDGEAIGRFIAKWDRPGRALYFCVATIRDDAQPLKPGGSPRCKENVAEILMLQADVDLKDIDIPIDEALARIAALPMPPSIVVRSGNGLHLYWLLNEGIAPDEAEVQRVEAALRQLADLVGGDLSVAEISRLMRVPGTHNTKEGAWKEVVIESARYEPRYSLDDIEEMLGYMSPVIQRRQDASAKTATNPFLEVANRLGFKPPIDVERALAEMLYQGVGGRSIHDTQLRVSASLLNHGVAKDEVVATLLDATRAAAGDYGGRWNWQREERAIRRMCDDWMRKNPVPKVAQREAVAASGGGNVVSLASARPPRNKKADKVEAPIVVAEGVIEALRRAGHDLLLSEGEVWIYDDGVWRVLAPSDQQWIMTLIQEGFEAIGEPSKTPALNAAWKRLNEHPGLFRRKVPWLEGTAIVARNGVLDVVSGQFKSFSPDLFARRKIGASFDAAAACPRFLEFVRTLFSDRAPAERDGVISLLQEWVGAALVIRMLSREERKALVLVGPSRTGKTELSRFVRLLVGGTIATPSVAEISERFGLASLFDASAWIRDDAINEGDQLDPQRFKTIVTGEPIDIERKHKPPVPAVELALPVLLTTNALPRSRDRSDAIYNRAFVVEMTNVFDEAGAFRLRSSLGVPRGQTLAYWIFDREGPGILNWALTGLNRLLERGRFEAPDSVQTAVQRFKDDNNPVAEFARTATIRRSTTKVARHDLLCAFHGWQREQEGDEARAFGARAFLPRLRSACPWIGDTTDDGGKRFVSGLALSNEGLQLWQSHYDGPQLRGGSKGLSFNKSDVNRAWRDEPPDPGEGLTRF